MQLKEFYQRPSNCQTSSSKLCRDGGWEDEESGEKGDGGVEGKRDDDNLTDLAELKPLTSVAISTMTNRGCLPDKMDRGIGWRSSR